MKGFVLVIFFCVSISPNRLLQGYGLTETCGAATASFLDDASSGHNGYFVFFEGFFLTFLFFAPRSTMRFGGGEAYGLS